jgi:hypothetical protein
MAPPTPQLPPAKRKTVRARAEETRHEKNKIAEQALLLAKNNVSNAMDYTEQKIPYEFLQRSEKCVKNS